MSARPYSYRLNGAVGRIQPLSYPGGIFGQPNRPRNHLGIFESQYAIPDYVEEAELTGGPLFADTLKADATLAEPIEKGITAPDLGPPIRDLYPTYRRRVMRRRQAQLSRNPAMGNDDVVTTVTREVTTQSAPRVSVGKKGLLDRPVAGPLVLIGVGVFVAYALFGK